MAEEVKYSEEQVAKFKDEAKAEAKKELEEGYQKRFNEAAAAERKSYEKKLADSKLSQEELIKKEREDEFKRLTEENASFKTKLSTMLREKAVGEAKLPSHYLNDVRLINAKDEELPKIVKELVGEHEAYIKELTKGSVGNTAPKATPNGSGTGQKDPILQKYGIPQR